jgi:hypothetical protein
MGTEDNKSVVIATTNCEKALYIIAKDAMIFDTMDIHFTEKYAPTVEYLLRMIRKGFGWMETERGTKEVHNTRCIYNHKGLCNHKKNLEERGIEPGKLRCTESVRTTCPHYKPRFESTITVNFVTIEKAGGIRNM